MVEQIILGLLKYESLHVTIQSCSVVILSPFSTITNLLFYIHLRTA